MYNFIQENLNFSKKIEDLKTNIDKILIKIVFYENR